MPILFVLSLALGACAHTPAHRLSDQNSAHETSTMTTPASSGIAEQGGAPLRPRLTAEQALTRLLELIHSSRHLDDFTPERLREVMGTEITYAEDGADRYGFGEQITADWSYGFGVDKSAPTGPHFLFDFNPVPPGTSPDMTDICQLDFEKFSAELESMGFIKTPSYGEHGRLMHYTFNRMKDGINEMTIQVHLRGRASDSAVEVRHDCVKMLTIF
jgi:hypothetical protein